jgi:hypothetical protein
VPERMKAEESKKDATKNWLSLPMAGENGVALAASQTCSRSPEDMERLDLAKSDFLTVDLIAEDVQSGRWDTWRYLEYAKAPGEEYRLLPSG